MMMKNIQNCEIANETQHIQAAAAADDLSLSKNQQENEEARERIHKMMESVAVARKTNEILLKY